VIVRNQRADHIRILELFRSPEHGSEQGVGIRKTWSLIAFEQLHRFRR